MSDASEKEASLYRMVMDKHVCPYGLKSKALLQKKGYRVADQWLRTRSEVESFKENHKVKTTPQTFIDGVRIGYDDLRRHFGMKVRDPKGVNYNPVLAVFGITALMALALNFAVFGKAFTIHAVQWFMGLL